MHPSGVESQEQQLAARGCHKDAAPARLVSQLMHDLIARCAVIAVKLARDILEALLAVR